MKAIGRTVGAAVFLAFVSSALAAATGAPIDSAKYYRCGSHRWGEAEARIVHLKVSSDRAVWHSELSPSSGPLKDFKETDFTYEWCEIACGEYESRGHRYRAGPIVLHKRSLGLSQVLEVWTPTGWDDRYLFGSCDLEDGAHYENSKPIVD